MRNKKLVAVTILSISLFANHARAIEAGSVVGAISDLVSVPVNDAQLREDLRLFRQKEIGTGSATTDALKNLGSNVGSILGDIAKKFPKLPTLPIPKIGGIDLGKWGSVGQSIFNAAKGLVSARSWDSIAVSLSRITIDKIFDDMTDWANTGFEGNPSFAYNLNDWLKRTGDSVVGQAISEITGGFACQPFRLELRASITRDFGVNNRGRYFQNYCTLSDIKGNVENFLNGDFSQGGWQSWFKITQIDENNPYGEYLLAVNNISANIAGARDVELKRLDWSQGFFGKRKCVAYAKKSGPPKTMPDGTLRPGDMVEDKEHCLVWDETTPGSLLASQVSKVAGTAIDQTQLANRFDEFLGAVVKHYTNRIFSGRDFITNIRGSGYKKDPITGTVDYGGGAGTSSSVGSACSVDNSSPIIGETVNWGVQFSAGENANASFSWSGDEVPNGTVTTEPNLPIQYKSAGTKKMNISVSYQEADPSSFSSSTQSYTTYAARTENLSCAQTVTVARYKPLTASCSADIKHARAGKDLVTYTFALSGGSGSLYSFRITDMNQYEKPFANSNNCGWVFIDPSGKFSPPSNSCKGFTGTLSKTTVYNPTIFSKNGTDMIIKIGKIYDHPENLVGVAAEIIDADNTVPVLQGIKCGDVVITD